MKKLIFSIVSICLLVGSMFAYSTPLQAKSEEVTLGTFLNDIQVDIHSTNGLEKVSLVYLKMGEELVYCIEPIVPIHTGTPVVPSDTLNESTRKHLSYIASSGYNVSNRQSDKWYAATQLYIWEVLGYTFQMKGFDDYVNYKQEIIQRVNAFEKLPSFHGEKVTLQKGMSKIIEDKNNVLSLFQQIHHEGSAKLQVNGNVLSLSSDTNVYSEGKIQIKKVADEEVGLPIVYQGANQVVQKVIKPFIPTNFLSELWYRNQSFGKIRIDKQAMLFSSVKKMKSDFGEVYVPQFEKGTLPEVKVEIYAKEDIVDVWGRVVHKKDALLQTLTSTKQGVSSIPLMSGRYYVKESKSVDGYIVDETIKDVTISNNNAQIEEVAVNLFNEKSKVNIQLKKVWEEGSLLDISEAYQDVVFGIYTKQDLYAHSKTLLVPKDNLVFISGLTKEGYLKENIDLPLGEYYLRELQTNEHFVLEETKYHFSIKPNGKEIIPIVINNGVIENKLHRSDLIIHKVDKQSEKPLQATFTLFDSNYKEVETFTTNEKGKNTLTGLVDGTYYVQEIKAQEGYHLDEKMHKVEVKEDMTYTITNQKKVVNASVETRDSKSHKPFEFSMLGSMCAVYYLLFKKMRTF